VLLLLVKPAKAAVVDGYFNCPIKIGSEDLKGDREIKKEFDVKSGGKLTIDLKTGSSIEIRGWDKDLLSARVIIEREDRDNPMEFNFEKRGNDVEITSEFQHRSRNTRSNAKLIVNLPQKYNVDFNTMGGAVIIENVEGNTEGKTMGGAINLKQLKGTVNTETMGGAISLSNSEVDGTVKTMGGAVNLENVKGDVDASTMGGAVRQTNVQGRDKSGKGVKISTMGGPIEVDQAPNGAHLKTMGGKIHVNKAAKFVYAETMGGEVSIDEIDGGVEASTMGGDVDVKMVGDPKVGERNVSLSSKGGDITLTVPAELPMDIDIKIIVSDEDNYNKYKIVSDFPVKEEKVGDWKEFSGSDSNYIKGKGTVNGGGNKIKIRTVNGDVYLKKG
jgi:hypothetical protein